MPRIPRSICSNPLRPSCWRSPRRDGRPLALLAFVATTAAFGQASVAPKEQPHCGSVVVVRCERAEVARSGPREQARPLEQRRAPADPLELDRIVIEADSSGRGIEGTMSRALGLRPSWGTRTFATAEGAQCTCMNICPPWPLPCCQCSSHMRGYSSSPGSSPFK